MGLKEECGIVGVLGHQEAARLSCLALHALQHRGQEACGIVAKGEVGFHSEKGLGLVSEVFTQKRLGELSGSVAIGHNRYSTSGKSSMVQNIQPFLFNTSAGSIAIAHNGNITNADTLRRKLESEGSIFQSTSDTEIIVHLLAKAKSTSILGRLLQVLPMIKGAYSMVLLSNNCLYAIRDRFGFRPLVLGKQGDAHIVASETCALDLVGTSFTREVEPGEIVEITKNGTESYFPFASVKTPRSFCAFEIIYFARPDSQVLNKDVYSFRKEIGRQLALETHVEADIVVAVPDSGVPVALGYSEITQLPTELGLIRNHYVGRTFIEPAQSIRDFGVKLKLNAVKSVLEGKRVVVVDDSLVRGTTSIKIIRMIRQVGAKEVHLRLGAPPIVYSCYFGVDTPNRESLLAAQSSCESMREKVGADTLGFLSLEGLRKALGGSSFCFGCFNGKYPEDIDRSIQRQPVDDYPLEFFACKK